MPKNITLTSGVAVRLTRVKAKNILRGAQSSTPLLYEDTTGTVQYGTLWNRADKGGLVFADRAQVRLGRGKAKRPKKGEPDYAAHLADEQAKADAALQRVDPEQYVWVTTDPEQVALHPDSKVCGGSEGKAAHGSHLKVIYPNPSRNPWCNDWERDLKATEVTTEDDADDEVAAVEPLVTVIARTKAAKEQVRAARTPAQRAQIAAALNRHRLASA